MVYCIRGYFINETHFYEYIAVYMFCNENYKQNEEEEKKQGKCCINQSMRLLFCLRLGLQTSWLGFSFHCIWAMFLEMLVVKETITAKTESQTERVTEQKQRNMYFNGFEQEKLHSTQWKRAPLMWHSIRISDGHLYFIWICMRSCSLPSLSQRCVKKCTYDWVIYSVSIDVGIESAGHLANITLIQTHNGNPYKIVCVDTILCIN